MSELIQSTDHTNLRWTLLASASALALLTYVASSNTVKAEDVDRPTVWIELGGQMEQVQGVSSPFIAPFMTAISPTPGPYANDIFVNTQRPARLAFGEEGKITLQPHGSDWNFSASIRFGRSQTNREAHQQSPAIYTALPNGHLRPKFVAAFANSKLSYDESHAILDFAAGKDVGLGAFGREGTSNLSVGVRFAQFSNKSNVNATGRPSIQVVPAAFLHVFTFYNYTMFAHATRSFHGAGPSLSWNASAALLGSRDDGELTLDWGINGAVLFGRQKAKVTHNTQAYHLPYTPYITYQGYNYTRVPQKSHHGTRIDARSVVVPNLGGFAGLSVKYPNAKFSVGYRADFFFGAVDAGIDTRHTKTLGFSGPFATISIGLGG